jgi:hypothetical protein
MRDMALHCTTLCLSRPPYTATTTACLLSGAATQAFTPPDHMHTHRQRNERPAHLPTPARSPCRTTLLYNGHTGQRVLRAIIHDTVDAVVIVRRALPDWRATAYAAAPGAGAATTASGAPSCT